MKGPWVQAAGVVILAALAGCSSTAGPCWLHPGSAPAQQTRPCGMIRIPSDDEPDSAMAGVRPREYDKPPPETSRARWHLGQWGQ